VASFNIIKNFIGTKAMKNLSINHNYYNWKISSGDYYRDYESTERYEKKVAMKKRLEKFKRIFLYMGISFTLLILLSSYIF